MKKFICIVLIMTLTMTLLVAHAFAWESHPVDMDEVDVDVGASNWAVTEIKAAYEAGLIPELTGNPKFTDAITREQFAELVVQLTEKVIGEAIPLAADTTFTDCNNPAVLKAYSAEIVSGVGNDLFAPNQTTNREQISAMLARAISFIELRIARDIATADPDLSKFTDKNQVSAWAVDGMGLMAANGLMKGTSETTLSPKASCTVEQSILFVFRVYERSRIAKGA
jgi:hypothetical protein